MKTKNLVRVLSLLMALAMLVSLASGVIVAKAEEAAVDSHLIDPNAKGSITVTKYKTTNLATGANGTTQDAPETLGNANGTTGSKPDTTNKPYELLDGATFELYRVMTAAQLIAYYNGTIDSEGKPTPLSVSVSSFYQGKNTPSTPGSTTREFTVVDYDGNSAGRVDYGTTVSGVKSFEGLGVGLYLLVETSAPETISAPLSEPCLVSIPMVNTDKSNNLTNDDPASSVWLYDVSVYPKNHMAEAQVNLTKFGQTGETVTELDGTKFGIVHKVLSVDATGNLVEPEKWSEDEVVFTTADGGKINFGLLPANLYGTIYKIYEKSTSVGYVADTRPIVFTVMPNNTIAWEDSNDRIGLEHEITPGATPVLDLEVTNYQLTIEKTVQANGSETSFVQGTQYNVGDTFKFQIEVDVPKNAPDMATFKIVDEYDAKQFKVTGPVTVAYGESTKIETSWNVDNELVLTEENVKDIAGKKITITYTVELLADAVNGGTGNVNTASVIYSQDIGTENPPTYTITDMAVVYTYDIELDKTMQDSSNNVTPGKGVEFKLLKGTEKKELNVVEDEQGQYHLATTDEPTTTNILKTDAAGKIVIKGLELDTYYLREVKTLTGYNMLASDVDFVITNTFQGAVDIENAAFTAAGELTQEKTSDCEYKTVTKDVVNKQGFVLPQTGSMGYLLFCTAGLVLMAGGAFMIFGNRKKVIR